VGGLSQDPFTLLAPPLVFGAAPIGGLYAPVSDADAAATLAAAWGAGIRAFDTAPHYGVGLSEQRLGDFLADRPRSEFAVCTKVGRRLVPASGPVEGADGFYGTPALTRVRDYTADGVRRCLEDSLRRLRLDRVDIALIHDPDDFMTQALDSAYPALAELRDAGVVGAIGVGMNYTAPLAWFVSRADLDCVLMAGRYSLLDRSGAAELLPLCAERGVKVLAGGVFNSGILADPRDGATYDYAPASAEVLARARRIKDMCDAYGVPAAAAALQFTLQHPAVTAAVVGARSPAEITADASYLTLDIPEELFAALAAVRALRYRRQPLLDPRDVHRRPGPGGLGVARGERVQDRPVLGERPGHRPGLGDPAPHPGTGHRPGHGLEQRREHRVPRGRHDPAVELHVLLDQLFRIRVGSQAVEQLLQALDLFNADPLRRHRGGGRLEDAPDLEELEHRVVAVEVDDEVQRLQQLVRLQARHVGPVAAPHVEDVD